MDERNPAIGFIGAGLLGTGLALALAARKFRVIGAYSRSLSSAQALAEQVPGCQVFSSGQDVADAAELVFITTPDSAITTVAASVAWRAGQGVVHCCGASSIEILQVASDQGAVTGAFHPFQTFASLTEPAEAASRLSGVTFAVAGHGWLAGFLQNLAGELGGRPVSIADGDRALYHSAAVLGCGYLAALLQAVVEMWQAMGFSQQQAVQTLYPLSLATLNSVAREGVASAVTGPVIRGDVETIHAHLDALSQRLPHLVPLYGSLAAASLPLAAGRGVAAPEISAMKQLIDRYSSPK